MAVVDHDRASTPDELPVELRGVAVLESAKFLVQLGVKGVSDHGHYDVEVEKIHCLGNSILHPPSTGIMADNGAPLGGEVAANDGTDRVLYAVFVQEFGDLASREMLFDPGDNFAAYLGSYTTSGTASLWCRLGEVDLAVTKVMPEEIHVAGAVAEAIRYAPSGQTFDERTQETVRGPPGRP